MIKDREFTFEERIDIANRLSMHHVIFQTFGLSVSLYSPPVLKRLQSDLIAVGMFFISF